MRRTKIVMGLATVSLVISGIASIGCSGQSEQVDGATDAIPVTATDDAADTDAPDADERGWQSEDTLAKACEMAGVEPFVMPARFTVSGIEFGRDVRYWHAGQWVMAEYEAEGKTVLVTKWPTATGQGEVMGVAPSTDGMREWKVSFDGTDHVYRGPRDNAVRVAEWEDGDSGMSYMLVSRETRGSGDFAMTDAEVMSIISGIED